MLTSSLSVIVGCETSGIIRNEFAKRGWNAWSCDLLPTEIPGNHIQCKDEFEIFDIINSGYWHLGIFHPECRFLCNSGSWCLYKEDKTIDLQRWHQMRTAAEFFKRFLNLPIEHTAVENSVMHGHAVQIIGKKQTHTIQPYQFGHPESKRTALWLKNLPSLIPTNRLPKPARGYWDNQTPTGQNKYGPAANRSAVRAKTYEGIAAAMADQWGSFIEKKFGIPQKFEQLQLLTL